MKKLLALGLLAFVAGCVTIGEPYSRPPPLPQDQARVFFLRSSVWHAGAWSTIFRVDDAEVVSLYNNGYSWIHLDPGTYKFTAGPVTNPDPLKFTMPVQAGREYFIEYYQEG